MKIVICRWIFRPWQTTSQMHYKFYNNHLVHCVNVGSTNLTVYLLSMFLEERNNIPTIPCFPLKLEKVWHKKYIKVLVQTAHLYFRRTLCWMIWMFVLGFLRAWSFWTMKSKTCKKKSHKNVLSTCLQTIAQ